MKKRREKTTEDYEKDSAVSSVIAGVIMIIIALWILATNVTWVSFAISLLLIAVGGFLIFMKRAERTLKGSLPKVRFSDAAVMPCAWAETVFSAAWD